MATCALCGKEKDSGTNYTVYTGLYLTGSSTYTQLSAGMQQVSSKYHSFVEHPSFVCDSCATATETKQKIMGWPMVGIGVVAILILFFVFSSSPTDESDQFIALCVGPVFLGVGCAGAVYWILEQLGFDKTVVNRLKEKAKKERQRVATSSIVSAFSQEEYNQLSTFRL